MHRSSVGGINSEHVGLASEDGGEARRIQAEVEARIVEGVRDFADYDAIPKQKEAFGSLLRGRGVYDTEASGLSIASYVSVSSVSLPVTTAGSPLLTDIAPEEALHFMRGKLQRMLRSTAEYERLAAETPVTPYWDRTLRSNRRKYTRFIRALHRRGLIRFLDPQRVRGRVGVFFVRKKSGALRLIIDARDTNMRFCSPPSVSLVTAEGFGMVEVEVSADIDVESEEGRQVLSEIGLCLGVGDIADAFHRFRIDEFFSSFFGMDDVRADEVGMSRRDLGFGRLCADSPLTPCFTSLPMGFTWSLYFCQVTGEHQVALTSGMEHSVRMHDKGGPMILRACRHGAVDPHFVSHYVYVDNIGIFSIGSPHTRERLDGVMSHFSELGLQMHEVEIFEDTGETLGTRVSLSGLSSALSKKRYWRVRQGLRYALSRRALPGAIWLILVGHITYCCLTNRDLMSLLFATYKFARLNLGKATPLWASAREELVSFLGLMPLLRASWTLPWCPTPVASDASEQGYGICIGDWPQGETTRVGRVPERARFRKLGGTGAREHYFEQAGLAINDEGEWTAVEDGAKNRVIAWDVDKDFPEVPAPLLAGERWRPVVARAWARKDEDIFVYEARALVRAVEVLCAEMQVSSCRVLCLVDNMSVALCFSRRRSKEYVVITLIRRFIAICITRNIKAYIRWIPSELNASDAPSRIFDVNNHHGPGLFEQVTDILGADGPKAHPDPPGSPEAVKFGRNDDSQEDTVVMRPECSDREDPLSLSPEAQSALEDSIDGSEAFWSPCASSDSHKPGPGRSDGSQVLERGPSLQRCDLGGSPGSCSQGEGAACQDLPKAEVDGSGGGPSDSCAADLFGASTGTAGDGAELRGCDGPFSGVLQRGQAKARRGCRGGQRARAILQRPLCSGPASSLRRSLPGGADALSAPVLKDRGLATAEGVARPQGLAQARALTLEACIPPPGLGGYVLGACPWWPLGHGGVLALDADDVQSSQRASVCATAGHQRSDGASVPGLDSSLVARGKGCPQQDSGQRRLPVAEHPHHPLVHGPRKSSGRRPAERPNLQVQLRRVHKGVCEGPAQVENPKARAVPVSPLRSQHRPLQQLPQPRRGQGQGPLGLREEHDALQPSSETGAVNERLRPAAARLLCRGRKTVRGTVLRQGAPGVAPSPIEEQGRFFADTFCGVAHVGRTAARRGFKTRFYDILIDPIYGDMTNPKVKRFLRRAVKTGRCFAMMLQPLCASWSIARHRTNVIRSGLHPWGLPRRLWQKPWSDNDHKALATGNATMSSALELAAECQRNGVPWALENPATSIVWLTPEVLKLLAMHGVRFVLVDFCYWGTPWRKRTGILFGHCDGQDLDSLAKCRCSGVGTCSNSGRKHVQLTGSDPHGMPWTKRAEPYPPGFAHRLASILLHKAVLDRSLRPHK